MTTSKTPDAREDDAREASDGDAAGAERPPRDDTQPDDTQPGDTEAREAAPEEPSVEDQLAAAEDRFLRAQAEIQNTRRRARVDQDEALLRGKRDALLDVLPALDALQRALAGAASVQDDALLEGLRQTEALFLMGLQRHNIEPVPAEPGTALDPSVHRALLEQPSDEFAPGTIVVEITRGYRLGDRLLREAEVVVASRAPAGDA